MDYNKKMKLYRKYLKGFTLIELVIVIMIGLILLLIAVPSYRFIIANNKGTEWSDELSEALYHGRNEAIRRNASIQVCGIDNSNNCLDAATQWTNGWGVFTTTQPITAIQIFPASNASVSISPNTAITFLPTGIVKNAQTFTFTIQPPNCKVSYSIILRNGGEFDVTKGTCP